MFALGILVLLLPFISGSYLLEKVNFYHSDDKHMTIYVQRWHNTVSLQRNDRHMTINGSFLQKTFMLSNPVLMGWALIQCT